MTANEAKPYYTKEEWQTAFKIASVRNPWDRLVSLYAQRMFLLQNYGETEDAAANQLLVKCGCYNISAAQVPGGWDTTQDDEIIQATFGSASPYECSFDHFLKRCAPLATRVPVVVERPDGTTFDSTMYENAAGLPQLGYYTETDSMQRLGHSPIALDFIMREENVQEHLVEALVAAGYNSSLAEACGASLLHVSAPLGYSHADASDFFPTKELQGVAKRLFAVDSEYFGYEFNVSGPMDVPYRSGWSKKEDPS